MSKKRSTRLVAKATRDLTGRLGKQIVGLREEAGVTQAQLARCARIAQSYLWEVERGDAFPSLSVLTAIGQCLGADLGVRYFPGAGPRIHDRFQAPMVEALIRSVAPAWVPQPEVPVTAARGVLDLVLRNRGLPVVIACECHSELRRLELVIRRLSEKAEALQAEIEPTTPVSRLLLLRSTVATRSIARAYVATLCAAFPVATTQAVASLRSGLEWPGPAVVWARVEGGRAEILDRPPRGVRVGL